MSAHEAEKEGRRKRKSRTGEVSSPSSSERSTSPGPTAERIGKMRDNDYDMTVEQSSQANGDNEIRQQSTKDTTTISSKATDPEQAFDDFYLKQATKEFANDLDKLRSAGDFKEGSVPVLIAALKQGRACFTAEERTRVGGAAR